jgi:aspartate aminotransferase
MRDAFARRRARMVEGLRAIPGVRCRIPEGAFYAFADVRGLYGIDWNGRRLASDEDVALWLLDEVHVATVAGTPFGAPGYLRFSYTCSEAEIDEGLTAIRRRVGAST